ncbi:hypothetical protein ACFQ22_01835 [Lentilactobacillus raoultii]|uniref:Uncharacterized protein n=1 Tax=Lentilactobacillus raoultii TaxID=1987503 RepID=A0ABW3PJH3_9LACO|nr:hypothetical protein [Lentilactobacillus raoultii]
MTLKHILYTSTAALAMIAPTLATSVAANAATGAPTQTTAQAGKTNNNQQAGKAINNKQAGDKTTNQATAKAGNQNTNQTSAKTANSQAAKANDNKAADNKATSSTPAKANDHASNNNSVKTTPAKTDASQSLSKVDFGAFKTSTPTKVAQDYTHKAPRYTGSSYTDANQGYSTSVTATNDNATLNYAVSTYNSDGSASSQPFAIKIYKDGSLYKTLKSSTGAAKGSLNVDKGTYSLKVLTSASAHYTGGLSLS